jgi:bifunctional DNA-binding transcriptional regulator/antitoxin component of YhaV-PrlF toxin-antitoxin module
MPHRSAIALGVLISLPQILGCSLSYPAWPKSKRSDTPLFRFVIEERNGAGYINREGKIVIPPQLRVGAGNDGDFFNGLAKVTLKDGTDVYIDTTGKPIANAHYLTAGDFSEGLATRYVPETKTTGYIDTTGKLAIPARFEHAGDFSDGLAFVLLQGRYGYIDRTGKLQIPAKFSHATSFTDGHAWVTESPCERVDRSACAPANFIPYGATPVTPKRCRYTILNKQGALKRNPEFIDVEEFSEGLAPVGNGKAWGYTDTSGVIRIPMQFERVSPFSEGLARVVKGGKVGFIDKSGRFVIPPTFLRALSFSEGVAVVVDKRDKYSFIDKQGNRAIPGEFDAATSLVMGLAHVRTGIDYYSAKWSYIEKSGKPVFTYSDQSKRRR